MHDKITIEQETEARIKRELEYFSNNTSNRTLNKSAS